MDSFLEKLYTRTTENKFGILRNYIMLLILLILIIFCLIRINQTTVCEGVGVLSTLCSDNNDCSNDYLFRNTTCQSFNKFNGSNCDSDELCFDHELCQPTCQLCVGDCEQPQCIGPRECCRGFCTTDEQCEFLVPFLVFNNSFDFFCLQTNEANSGGCHYEIFNTRAGTPEQCLELVDGPIKNCLHATTSDTLSFNGYCFFDFKCAPPLTGSGGG